MKKNETKYKKHNTTDKAKMMSKTDPNKKSGYSGFLHQKIWVLRIPPPTNMGTQDSSTNKTDRHDMIEILLKVA